MKLDSTKTKKGEEGFSLVEILLAVAILAIVCLGIMALLPNGYMQITNAGRKATIDHIGQRQLDYLRSIPVTHIDLTAGTHPTAILWPMPNGVDDKYSVYWEVDDYTSLTNARSVRVYVGYDVHNADGSDKTSGALEQQQKVFTTLITQ